MINQWLYSYIMSMQSSNQHRGAGDLPAVPGGVVGVIVSSHASVVLASQHREAALKPAARGSLET